MKQHQKNRQGFTFAELLIVTAVLALVSVISLAHYEKASATSMTTEAISTLRFTSIGVEAYKVDQGLYPYDGYRSSGPGLPGQGYWFLGSSITTPVAYLPSKDIDDPFRQHMNYPPGNERDNIRYTNVGSTWSTDYSPYTGRTSSSFYYETMLNSTGGWRLVCVGPDKAYGPTSPGWDDDTGYPASPIPYDPTNGLMSSGDFLRTQKYSRGYYNVQ